LTTLLFFCFSFSYAQLDYKGKVIDTKTKEAIPYVNIGIAGAGIGTVSDEKGLFHLTINPNEYPKNTQILFSALGYETFYIAVSNINKVYNAYPEVTLEPSIFELDEVVVSNKGERFIQDNIGYRNYGERSFGYWKDNIALGGELASRIKVRKGLRKLNSFEFEVWQNPSDSLLLRVNIYDSDGQLGKPRTNLNTSGKNIFCIISKDDKMVRVDLEPFDIYTKDDFLISLELLEVFGEEDLGLVLSATSDNFGSYRKYSSQDKWEFLSDVSMAFYLESQLMVSEKLAQRYERRVKKRKEKQETIAGFVILNGKMISEVSIFNQRTKEIRYTDDKGRYRIPAKANDVLKFSKKGFQDVYGKVGDKPTLNALMKPIEN
jgi:hypothetical protein